MIALPPWADNAVARALLAQLVETPPETFVRSPDAWRHDAEERFSCKGERGKPLAALRRLYKGWFERQLAALDAQFHVVGHWDADASRALHETEDADALLRRVIAASEERADLEPKEIGDGRFQVAA